MRNLIIILITVFLIVSCGSTNNQVSKTKQLPEGAVRIANDSIEYEIIIFDIGFETYLNTIAKPDWYYSLQTLETKNLFYATEWNIRVQNPQKYNPTIYENTIDYNPNISYGLEVNYKLYNYFKFVEYKYKEKF